MIIDNLPPTYLSDEPKTSEYKQNLGMKNKQVCFVLRSVCIIFAKKYYEIFGHNSCIQPSR